MSEGEPRQQRILEALIEHGVQFVLIGAHALGVHGYVRATKDVDVVPDPDRSNLERLLAALHDLDARMEPVDIPEHGEQIDVDFLSQGGNFIFQTRHGRLDVLQFISGPDLTYGELSPGAERADLDGLPVRVCSYERLVEMKVAADRGQDRVDLERLREARGEL